MGDFGGLLLLGLFWLVVNALVKKRDRPEPRRRVGVGVPGAPEVGDATQREGSRLEMLLREMERALDQSSGPMGRPSGTEHPQEEEVEELETLETAPEVESLETEVRRPMRVRVDRDDQAEAVEAGRVAAAAARGGSVTRVDHAAFDQRIRVAPADHTAVKGFTPKQLRDAVVWREILGPPKGLE